MRIQVRRLSIALERANELESFGFQLGCLRNALPVPRLSHCLKWLDSWSFHKGTSGCIAHSELYFEKVIFSLKPACRDAGRLLFGGVWAGTP